MLRFVLVISRQDRWRFRVRGVSTGFIVASLLFAGTLQSYAQPALSKPGPDNFTTVEEARTAFESSASVKIGEREGWKTFQIPSSQEIWSFAPQSSPAFPSAVRRAIRKELEERTVRSRVLCEADKADCDRLISQVNRFDQQDRPGPFFVSSILNREARLLKNTQDIQDASAQLVVGSGNPRDSEVVCRKSEGTGSRLYGNERCMSRAEWQFRDATYKEQMTTMLKDLRNAGH